MICNVDHFEIRSDVVCHYYEGHLVPEIRDALVKFLSYTEANVPTSELYLGFLGRQSRQVKELFLNRLPDRELWEKEGQITSACCREMVKQMKELPDITNENSFNWILYHFAESDFVVPQQGIILNKKISVSWGGNPIIFGLMFSFMLNRTATPSEFLKDHFTETFNGDQTSFEEFLTLMLDDNRHLLESRRATIELWIKNHLKGTRVEITLDEITHFRSAFTDEGQYDMIVQLLSKPERGQWFDRNGKFNKNKGVLGALWLLEMLKNKGYFRQDLTLDQTAMIPLIKRWFDISISPKSSNLRKSLPENLSKELDAIPSQHIRR